MYWTFGASMVATFLLSYPTTRYVVQGIEGPIHFTLAMGIVPFAMLTFVLGMFMSFGMAAVYKHIPVYYPDNVGSVGGLVGMIGGLGGFALPIAFGAMADLTGRLDQLLHAAVRAGLRRDAVDAPCDPPDGAPQAAAGCADFRSCPRWRGSAHRLFRRQSRGRRYRPPGPAAPRAGAGPVEAPRTGSGQVVRGRGPSPVRNIPYFGDCRQQRHVLSHDLHQRSAARRR